MSLSTDTLSVMSFSPHKDQGVDVTVVDSLPLFYEDQFVAQDTVPLTRYYSQREFAPGQEGTVLPYSPDRKSVV